MAKARIKPTHVTRGNVLDDLGFSPEQAAILKFKADLYQAILKHARKYSQKQLQVILAEPQPRVSELLNGKIANKSVDKLLYYAGRLGIEAKARFPRTNERVARRELAAAARWSAAGADVTIFDPKKRWTFEATKSQSLSHNTPFDDWQFVGESGGDDCGREDGLSGKLTLLCSAHRLGSWTSYEKPKSRRRE